MVVRLALLRDHLAHIIGEGIVVPDAHVLVDAARGAARTTRPDALDEGQPSRVHKCREVVGRLGLPHDAGAGHELRAQHAVVDDPNSGQGGGGRHASVSNRPLWARDLAVRAFRSRVAVSVAGGVNLASQCAYRGYF